MKKQLPFKYVPRLHTSIVFMLLLVAVMLLFGGRKLPALRSSLLLQLDPDFYLHVSNFSISYLLYAVVGYLWLLMGVTFRYILILGGAVLCINIIYELFIPILNTPDIVDAWYGFAGTLLAVLFILVTYLYGLEKIK